MKTVPTFTATIYAGFRVGRSDDPNHGMHAYGEAKAVVQGYCDAVGLCCTLTPTEFVYTRGSEPGVAVGLINYPRFPSDPATIRGHALELAARLKDALEQQKVSVVFPDETVMLGDPDA